MKLEDAIIEGGPIVIFIIGIIPLLYMLWLGTVLVDSVTLPYHEKLNIYLQGIIK